MNETPEQVAKPLEVVPNAPINPHVMQELQRLNDRITQQNRTMEMMWGRWERMFERESWLREAYPEVIEQHKAIEDLKRASMSEGVSLGGKTVHPQKMPRKGILRGNI